MAIICFIVACALVSFVVSLLVYEWRESDYIGCVEDVQEEYLAQYDAHRDQRPELSRAGGDAAYSQYTQQFDKWVEAGDTIDENQAEELRACD
jgi:hypothetical protein